MTTTWETLWSAPVRATGAVAMACLFLGDGTGGTTQHVPPERWGTGAVPPVVHVTSPRAESATAAWLKVIREGLGLSVSELADVFTVSRPTIYSWQRGQILSHENGARVRALALALEPHIALLSSQNERLGHRAVEGRQTVMQLLVQGKEPGDVIGLLARVLNDEAAQRERLTRRLERKAARPLDDPDAIA